MSDEHNNFIPKCEDMCPRAERSQRQRLNLIHVLETDFSNSDGRKSVNPRKMIKTYCRSAAGQHLNNCELIRPPEILLETVHYIISNVINDKRANNVTVYDFVNDRLRSVKQDGVIQRLSANHWFQILPPLVRFYTFSAYWLCDEPPHRFDPKLNRDQLLDCLLLFIKNYESNPNLMYAAAYAEAESLFLILDFKPENLNRAVLLNLPDPLFQNTLTLMTKWYTRNYCKVLRKIAKLSLLPACLFIALYLSSFRKNILQIMSTAYCCKNVQYPVSKLVSNLLYNSTNEALSECNQYGINVSSDLHIQFQKLNLDATCLAPAKKLKTLDEKLAAISVTDLLLKNMVDDAQKVSNV